MTERANRRVAYFNGNYVPEKKVVIPFRDRGFLFGDAVFDMTRTFSGRMFKLQQHVGRLYDSLRAVRIDPGLSPDESMGIWEEVLKRNLHLRGEGDDFWIGQRISRGVDAVGDEEWDYSGPTVIVECLPLPLRKRARQMRDGLQIVVPSVRRVPPTAIPARAKTQNKLDLVLAGLEAAAHNPDAWAVVLDVNGNLSEGRGSNIFLVKSGALLTPRAQFVLEGVSRATVIELASDIGISVIERDLDLYDAYTADEIFITSTSWCIVPASRINDAVVGRGSVPGPITKKLTEAYIDLVGCDFVAQYLRHI